MKQLSQSPINSGSSVYIYTQKPVIEFVARFRLRSFSVTKKKKEKLCDIWEDLDRRKQSFVTNLGVNAFCGANG